MARNYKIEVYGADDFLNDFYNGKSDPCKVVEKLENSEESTICIAFYFDTDVGAGELVKLVQWFEKLMRGQKTIFED